MKWESGGGRQAVYALSWYVSGNAPLEFDYLHGNISRQAMLTSTSDAGSKFDAFVMRMQFAF